MISVAQIPIDRLRILIAEIHLLRSKTRMERLKNVFIHCFVD